MEESKKLLIYSDTDKEDAQTGIPVELEESLNKSRLLVIDRMPLWGDILDWSVEESLESVLQDMSAGGANQYEIWDKEGHLIIETATPYGVVTETEIRLLNEEGISFYEDCLGPGLCTRAEAIGILVKPEFSARPRYAEKASGEGDERRARDRLDRPFTCKALEALRRGVDMDTSGEGSHGMVFIEDPEHWNHLNLDEADFRDMEAVLSRTTLYDNVIETYWDENPSDPIVICYQSFADVYDSLNDKDGHGAERKQGYQKLPAEKVKACTMKAKPTKSR